MITPDEFNTAIVSLNRIVSEHGHGSALVGLEVVAAAFGALLETYAKPNAENPEGMCDDIAAFRKHFALMIERGTN